MLPQAALDARAAGEIELAPPTFVSLLRLTASPTVADVLAEARSAPYERFEPHIHVVEDGFASVYAGDVAYDDASRFDEPAPRHRMVAVAGGWVYERT